MQRRLLARILRGQEEHLVELLDGKCLQSREQSADGLADAGRRLRQHAFAFACAAINRLGEFALSGTELVVHEFHVNQCSIACTSMRDFAVRPSAEAPGAIEEQSLEFAGLAVTHERRFGLGRDVEIDERDFESGQPVLLAFQVCTRLRLSPMQLTMVVGHALEESAVRLDLLKATPRRVVAVCSASNREAFEAAAQRDLRQVRRGTSCGDRLVTGSPFLCRR
ncbi:MAG: hypothetical protein ABIV63_15025 [Caldimonas sp.]